jgi:cholest-4-en-3-one 26-monooxygenase
VNSSACPFGPGFDFTSPEMREHGVPMEQYAQLRRTTPVWWNEQPLGTSGFRDGGFWVITKHQHVKAISLDPELWSANRNGTAIRLPDTMTPEQLEMTKAMMLNQDPPSHTRLRKLVSRLFTPRVTAGMREELEVRARAIVREAAEKDSGNFVLDVANSLPVHVIAELIGVPVEDREQFFGWTGSSFGFDDNDGGPDAVTAASAALLGYAYMMAENRRKCPADDIVTKLVHADIDGESLTEIEFGFFVVLLASAGSETTTNAITLGMNEFLQRPEQWELYKRERPATAVDEIIRWSTPVQVFQRTATRETEVGGVSIAAGQRVGLFYGSANFDEDVFEDPFEFDILRNPNPHLSFGGQGTHFCIGANLARVVIDVMLNAIADVLPDIEKLGELQRVKSGWTQGVKSLDVRYNAHR